jgi:hypothetical protein
VDQEFDMTTAGQTNKREMSRRQSHRRKGDIEITKIGGEGSKRQEVTVRYETPARGKEKATRSWFEEFALEWSEIFMPKKKKTNAKGGERL